MPLQPNQRVSPPCKPFLSSPTSGLVVAIRAVFSTASQLTILEWHTTAMLSTVGHAAAALAYTRAEPTHVCPLHLL